MIFRVEQNVSNFEVRPETAGQALLHIVGAVEGEDTYLLSLLPGNFVVAHSKRPLTAKEGRKVRDACHDLLEKFKLPVMRALVPMNDEFRLNVMRISGWQEDGIWRALRQNEDESWQDGLLLSFSTGGEDYGVLRFTGNQAEAENGTEALGLRPSVTANSGPLLIDALANATGPDFWPV